jgi:hypothetical protein
MTGQWSPCAFPIVHKFSRLGQTGTSHFTGLDAAKQIYGRKRLMPVVKGVSRRVIVVRSPDPRFFEQAIFLMKEDALHAEGVTAEQVVNEARQVAAGYIRRTTERPGKRRLPRQGIPGWAWFSMGAFLSGVVCWFLGVM